MTDHTPSTSAVRTAFSLGNHKLTDEHELARHDAFNRWLAAHDARIWADGHQEGQKSMLRSPIGDPIINPYVSETPRGEVGDRERTRETK
jgi:hypothetical protein